jgi:hypothetical protein
VDRSIFDWFEAFSLGSRENAMQKCDANFCPAKFRGGLSLGGKALYTLFPPM